MNFKTLTLHEEPSSPNVYYVIDGNGDGWYCYSGINDNSGYVSGECIQEDYISYDRNFGG